MKWLKKPHFVKLDIIDINIGLVILNGHLQERKVIDIRVLEG